MPSRKDVVEPQPFTSFDPATVKIIKPEHLTNQLENIKSTMSPRTSPFPKPLPPMLLPPETWDSKDSDKETFKPYTLCIRAVLAPGIDPEELATAQLDADREELRES